MRSKLPGFLFQNMAAMHATIGTLVESTMRDEIDRHWCNFKRVHYSLIPCTADGNRCKMGGHDMEPIFLNSRPTLGDIVAAIKDFPEAVEVTLNIDIRGFRTFQDFMDCEDPGFADTGIDLWKSPTHVAVETKP